VTEAIDAYEFNVAALTVYQFIWHEFCDWYIELSKEPLKAGGEQQAAARYVLVFCFDGMLRLIHPFMPFISEEIWQALRPYLGEKREEGRTRGEHLAVAKWPLPSAQDPLSQLEAEAMEHCRQATQAINSLRSLLGLGPAERAQVFIKAPPPLSLEVTIGPTGQISVRRIPLEEKELRASAAEATERINSDLSLWQGYASILGRVSNLTLLKPNQPRPPRTVFRILKWCQILVEAPATFDFEKQKEKLQRQQREEQEQLQRDKGRLENPEFMAKAPEEEKLKISLRQEESLARIAALQSEIISLQRPNE
jgi:valyl-tRNA synthetase